MADKFRTTYPINVTFGTGEQPTATKVNAINTQAKNGLALLEKAIGDPWNQSGDGSTVDSPLYIINLARQMGDMSLLNPVFIAPNVADADYIVIEQNVFQHYGKTEIPLDFTPITLTTTELDAKMTALGFTNKVASRNLVLEDVDWFIDAATAKIYLGSALLGTDAIEYRVQGSMIKEVSDGQETGNANVIPDPTQIDWAGLKIIQESSNKYLLVLPPRRPTEAHNLQQQARVPATTIVSGDNNEVTTGASPTSRFWYISADDYNAGSPTSPVRSDSDYWSIVPDEQYRYKFSEIIHDRLENGSSGEIISDGLLYLWDDSEKTIVEGLTFKVPEADTLWGAVWGSRPVYCIQVEGTYLDTIFNGYDSSHDTDNPADYQSRWKIICAGESLTGAMSRLRQTLTRTDHASRKFEPFLDHDQLINTQPIQGDRHNALPPSFSEGDAHPHYLSRSGSQSSESNQRDRYNNAMIGDLLLAAESGSSDNQRDDVTVDSQAIRFGSFNSGPYLRFEANSGFNILDEAGGITATSDNLVIGRHALRLEKETLLFGDSAATNPDGLTFDDSSSQNVFRFFADGSVNSSKVASGELWLIGTSYPVNVAQSPLTGENLDEWIHLESTSSRNFLEFKGNDLEIDGNGDGQDVIIGSNDSGTDLLLANKDLYFGSSTSTSSYIKNEPYLLTNRFNFGSGTGTEAARIAAAEIFLAGPGNSYNSTTGTISFDGTNLTFTAPLDALSDARVRGDLSVDQDATVGGDLRVEGTATGSYADLYFGPDTGVINNPDNAIHFEDDAGFNSGALFRFEKENSAAYDDAAGGSTLEVGYLAADKIRPRNMLNKVSTRIRVKKWIDLGTGFALQTSGSRNGSLIHSYTSLNDLSQGVSISNGTTATTWFVHSLGPVVGRNAKFIQLGGYFEVEEFGTGLDPGDLNFYFGIRNGQNTSYRENAFLSLGHGDSRDSESILISSSEPTFLSTNNFDRFIYYTKAFTSNTEKGLLMHCYGFKITLEYEDLWDAIGATNAF